MDKVNVNSHMVMLMKENGMKTEEMDKESVPMLMVMFMMGNGIMI